MHLRLHILGRLMRLRRIRQSLPIRPTRRAAMSASALPEQMPAPALPVLNANWTVADLPLVLLRKPITVSRMEVILSKFERLTERAMLIRHRHRSLGLLTLCRPILRLQLIRVIRAARTLALALPV